MCQPEGLLQAKNQKHKIEEGPQQEEFSSRDTVPILN